MVKHIIVKTNDEIVYELPGKVDQKYTEIIDGFLNARKNNGNIIVYDSKKEIEIPSHNVNSIEFIF